MKIIFVGSGNVATHLATAFKLAGHEIMQIYSRNIDHARQLALKVNAQPIDSYAQLCDGADLIVLAVSDDAIYEVARELRVNGMVVHTSGSVAMDALKPISEHYGVIYMPQSFVKNVEMTYNQLPFCLEASDEEEMKKLQILTNSVSNRIYKLNSMQRRKLHLASVMVNNFGNALNAMAQQMMNREGIPFELLFPLIEMTTQKIYHQGSLWDLQTGPAKRGDKKTIEAHRELLNDNKEMLQLYDLMTELIENATH